MQSLNIDIHVNKWLCILLHVYICIVCSTSRMSWISPALYITKPWNVLFLQLNSVIHQSAVGIHAASKHKICPWCCSHDIAILTFLCITQKLQHLVILKSIFSHQMFENTTIYVLNRAYFVCAIIRTFYKVCICSSLSPKSTDLQVLCIQSLLKGFQPSRLKSIIRKLCHYNALLYNYNLPLVNCSLTCFIVIIRFKFWF